MTVRDDVWNRELPETLPTEPHTSNLPVPWIPSAAGGASPVLLGGVGDVVPADDHAAGVDEPKPDALTQGWVRPPGGERTEALFVLAGSSMGIGRTERVTSPVWLDLNHLVHLDAIGDPVDGLSEIEITMDDGSVIGAGWSDQFCEAVVLTLTVLAERRVGDDERPTADVAPAGSPPQAGPPADSPTADDRPGPDVTFEDVSPDPAESPAAAAPPADAPVAAPAAESAASESAASEAAGAFSVSPAAPSQAAPSPTDQPQVDQTPFAQAAATSTAPLGRSASLELEDVVYLGGYPGQSKRRKKCTATMSRTGLELSGPGDLSFRISWESVKTVEVQNSDEARFRMNTKIHRDASALVVECDQGVTILLEARDCPTIALRSAIAQLMTDLPVVVV